MHLGLKGTKADLVGRLRKVLEDETKAKAKVSRPKPAKPPPAPAKAATSKKAAKPKMGAVDHDDGYDDRWDDYDY